MTALVAEYPPGGTSKWYGWQIDIFDTGRVTQRVQQSQGSTKLDDWQDEQRLSSLSTREVENLIGLAYSVDFLGLESSYNASYEHDDGSWSIITEQAALSLKIAINGSIHESKMYGATCIAGMYTCNGRHHPDKAAAKRFQGVESITTYSFFP